MKACTLGIGTGKHRDQFRKDMRGRDRERFSKRAAPPSGPNRLKAGPSRAIYEDGRVVGCDKRGHFTTAELREKNAKRNATNFASRYPR